MSRLRLDVNVSSTFSRGQERLEVELEMSDRAAGQLVPVDPPPGEKTRPSRKKKDSNSLPPLKYSLLDDMKLQITR